MPVAIGSPHNRGEPHTAGRRACFRAGAWPHAPSRCPRESTTPVRSCPCSLSSRPRRIPAPAKASRAAGRCPAKASRCRPSRSRSEINYVEVDAVVTDQQRRVRPHADEGRLPGARGRQAADRVDVRRSSTSRSSAPRRPSSSAGRSSPTSQTNASGLDGRIYLIVLDDLHTDLRAAPSGEGRRPRRVHRAQLRRQRSRRRRRHRAAAPPMRQEFTSNPRCCWRPSTSSSGSKLRSATLEQARRIQPAAQHRVSAIDRRSRTSTSMRARATTRARRSTRCAALADFMAGVRGRRKALVLRQRGHRLRHQRSVQQQLCGVRHHRRRPATPSPRRRAPTSAIYAVDPRGLDDAGRATLIEMSAPPQTTRPRARRAGLARTSSACRRTACASWPTRPAGSPLVNSQRLRRRAFDRIREDNSTLLRPRVLPDERPARRPVPRSRGARDPPGPDRPGASRLRRPARQGAGRQSCSTSRKKSRWPSGEALSSPVPVGGLRFAVFAAPFKANSPQRIRARGHPGRRARLAAHREGRFVLRHARDVDDRPRHRMARSRADPPGADADAQAGYAARP